VDRHWLLEQFGRARTRSQFSVEFGVLPRGGQSLADRLIELG